jgi:formate dehydrogenase subunit gamma
MSLFATVSLVGLIVVVGAACVHFLIFQPLRGRPAPDANLLRRLSWWELAVHWVLLLSLIGLALTGYLRALHVVDMHSPAYGWFLMAHCTFGSGFALALVAGALTWAESCALAKHDWQWARRKSGQLPGGVGLPAGRFDLGQKLLFWCLTAFGWLVLLSATLPLLKYFSTSEQAFLLRVHKAAGLGVLLGTLFHAYLVLCAKPGGFRLLVSGKVSEGWAKHYHSLWWEELSQGEKKQ